MYILKHDSIIPVKALNIALTQKVQDARIAQIEQLVAEAYGTKPSELDVFYKDTDAKLMCCFLLHHLLNYSIGSIAKKYRVYPLFLRNKIQAYYKQSLQDQAFMGRVTTLKNAFLNAHILVSEMQKI